MEAVSKHEHESLRVNEDQRLLSRLCRERHSLHLRFYHTSLVRYLYTEPELRNHPLSLSERCLSLMGALRIHPRIRALLAGICAENQFWQNKPPSRRPLADRGPLSLSTATTPAYRASSSGGEARGAHTISERQGIRGRRGG